MATDLVENILKVLDKNYVCAPLQDASSRFFILEEEDQGSKLPKIRVTDIPENAVLVSMDKRDRTGGIPKFLGEEYRKRCDYVLISPDMAVFIELKSSLKSSTVGERAGQFNGARALFEYLGAAIRFFIDDKVKWIPSGSVSYVVMVGTESATKRRSSPLSTNAKLGSPMNPIMQRIRINAHGGNQGGDPYRVHYNSLKPAR